MKNNENMQNSELIATLGAVIGSEVVVTAEALTRGLACVIEVLSKELEQKEEHVTGEQKYATQKQLATMFGADSVTMWRNLRPLVEAGRVEVVRFDSSEGKKGHPRFKIADVKRAFKENALAAKEGGRK